MASWVKLTPVRHMRQELWVLTLLVGADGGLWVSLHVHHDAALPVSLGVHRHLIACWRSQETN